MSHHNPNPQQQQPKQQDQPKAQPEWRPDDGTIFLVLSDDRFLTRTVQHLRREYGTELKLRAQTEINVPRLTDRNSIVCVYYDLDRDVVDPETGKVRARNLGRPARGGTAEVPPEAPDIIKGKPVHVRDYWLEGTENEAIVQLNNVQDENTGKFRDGLIATLNKTCRPCRVQHDVRERVDMLTLRTV